MTKTYHIADAAYQANMIAVRNADANHTILVLAGIGETIANYTEAQKKKGVTLTNPDRQTMSVLDSRVVMKMEKKSQELPFNIIAICTFSQYSKSEILAAKKYAVDNWGSEYFSVLAHSQGGYNMDKVTDDEVAGSIDGIVWVAPGPSNTARLAQVLTKAKVASWFLTSKLDLTTAGDLGKVTVDKHNSIVGAGGISYLTLYNDTTVGNEHSILDYVLSNPAQWTATGNAAEPKMSIYQFLLSNKRGQNPVPPTDIYKPVVEAPIPEPPKEEPPIVAPPVETPPIVIPPVVDPPVKPAEVQKALINAGMVKFAGLNDKIPSSVLNAGQKYKAKEGERCSGIMVEWTPEGNIFTMDIRDKDNYKQPAIIVGPYK